MIEKFYAGQRVRIAGGFESGRGCLPLITFRTIDGKRSFIVGDGGSLRTPSCLERKYFGDHKAVWKLVFHGHCSHLKPLIFSEDSAFAKWIEEEDDAEAEG